jgi:hypothetical protein
MRSSSINAARCDALLAQPNRSERTVDECCLFHLSAS